MTETNETTPVKIKPRMRSVPAQVPAAAEAMYALMDSARHSGLPRTTALLVHLRCSQINGCSFCAQMHSRELAEAGCSDNRLWTVAAWREAPYFTAAERAALDLAESLTRIADEPDPVPDEIWDEAARHFDEAQLSSLVLEIAQINVWNRFNVATRQPAASR